MWDRELPVLEEAIRRLSAEYDAFLYGTGPRPPIESRRHVEEMIRRLNAVSSDSSADRYRFTTLQGRYNALCERWERLQAEKESGRRPGLYGHFVEGAPAFAPRAPSASSAPAAGARPAALASTRSAPPAPPLQASPNEEAAASVTEKEGNPPDKDLFERYVAAKKARGENVGGYRYEEFAQSLEEERKKLKENLGQADLEFDVVEREGRVRLIAKRRPPRS